MRHTLRIGLLSLLLLFQPQVSHAQGPFAAQIQAALRRFLTTANTFTGGQVFTTTGATVPITTHNDSFNAAQFYSHAASSFAGPAVILNRSQGTQAIPLGIASGDTLGYFSWGGYNSADAAYGTGITFETKADGAWTSAGIKNAYLQAYTGDNDVFYTLCSHLQPGLVVFRASQAACATVFAAAPSAVVAIGSGHLVPTATGTNDLGATVLAWRNLYLSGTASVPTVNATTAYQANGTPGVTGTCDTPTFIFGVATTCGGAGGSVDGTYFVAGNFTTAANTNLQTITGLTWTFPATTALNIPFRCSFTYSIATAAVAVSFGIQDVTVAPTNGMFTGSMETALGTTGYGDVAAFSSTTATAVVTATPSAITTIWVAYMDGFIEQPSNASTSAFNIMVKTANSADLVTVYRGSYCKVG